jgi:hypothetical protein
LLGGVIIFSAVFGIRAVVTGMASAAPPPIKAAVTPATLALETCATSEAAVITLSDLTKFRLLVDSIMNASPLHTLPFSPAKSKPLSYQTFLKGRLRGYASDKAYDQQYLAESEEYQRRLGYAVTGTPMIPMQGQVVIDTKGILEVYQLNTVYTSPAGAQDFQKTQTDALGYVDRTRTRITLTSPLDTAVAYEIVPGVPGQENRYQIDLVQGSVQVDFQFRGGVDMPLGQIGSLVETGLDRLKIACQLQTSEGQEKSR